MSVVLPVCLAPNKKILFSRPRALIIFLAIFIRRQSEQSDFLVEKQWKTREEKELLDIVNIETQLKEVNQEISETRELIKTIKRSREEAALSAENKKKEEEGGVCTRVLRSLLSNPPSHVSLSGGKEIIKQNSEVINFAKTKIESFADELKIYSREAKVQCEDVEKQKKNIEDSKSSLQLKPEDWLIICQWQTEVAKLCENIIGPLAPQVIAAARAECEKNIDNEKSFNESLGKYGKIVETIRTNVASIKKLRPLIGEINDRIASSLHSRFEGSSKLRLGKFG
jgi:hypothetical protein